MSQRKVPDGGLAAWAVVFGFALSNIFNASLLSVFSLLFAEQLSDLGLSTTGAALVLNINIIVLNLSGFLTKQISQNFSHRSIFMVGCLFTSIGICLSSRATTAVQIIFAYGVPVGLGQGLMNASGFLAVNSCFEKNRGRALGVALAGTGIGQMLMPFIVKELLEEYGYRGATLLIGGLTLHGLIGGCLFGPVKSTKKDLVDAEETQKLLKCDIKESGEEILDENSNLLDKDKSRLDPVTSPGNYVWDKLQDILGIRLLNDPSFVNISAGIALVYTVSINFSLLYPYYLQETAQLSRSDTALAMTILASGDVLSRLTVPIITDKFKISARVTLLCGLILLIVIRSILAESQSMQQLLIFSCTYGYIRATTVVNQNLCLAEYCTDTKLLSSAVGLTMILKAAAVISVGQLLGFTRDLTNSYKISLHLQNVALAVVVLFWGCEIICKRRSSRRKGAGFV